MFAISRKFAKGTDGVMNFPPSQLMFIYRLAYNRIENIFSDLLDISDHERNKNQSRMKGR